MKISFSAILVLTAITLTACATRKASVVVTPPMSPVVKAPSEGPPMTNDEIAARIFEAVNKQRAANGLLPLEMSPVLARSAQSHSEKMLNGNFLSTRGADEPSVITRITSQGMSTVKLGEDVVRLNTWPTRVADETVTIWMGAASDRKNILSPAFTKTGIGIARAGTGADYYISQDFAQ